MSLEQMEELIKEYVENISEETVRNLRLLANPILN